MKIKILAVIIMIAAMVIITGCVENEEDMIFFEELFYYDALIEDVSVYERNHSITINDVQFICWDGNRTWGISDTGTDMGIGDAYFAYFTIPDDEEERLKYGKIGNNFEYTVTFNLYIHEDTVEEINAEAMFGDCIVKGVHFEQ